MEDGGDFVQTVGEMLRDGRTAEVLRVFNENESKLKVSSWDLIPLVTKYLTTQHESTNKDVFKCCEHLINVIAEYSKPDEALLQLIEEVEECEDTTKFIALLLPMKKVLFRVPQNHLISFAWGFNAIQSFLDKCQVPECNNLEGKEKILLENDEATLKIILLYKNVVQFYNTFEGSAVENNPEKVSVVCKFLVGLLGAPFVYLDVTIYDGKKSRTRLLSEQILRQIFFTTSDIVVLLDSRFDTENKDLFKLDTLGLASLFHLVYSKEIFIERVPKVYNPVHVFQNSVYLVTALIKADHQIAIEKGLNLLTALLKHVKLLKLSYLLLESVDHAKFCKTIATLIVYNDFEHVRKVALNAYKDYVLSFEIQGVYLLVFNLMSVLSHSGLISFTITLFKDLIVEEFAKGDSNFSAYLKGPKLFALLRKFAFLHTKERSDIIELSDQIIATLNLLRYLSLRDSQNVTCIWDHLDSLEEEYFVPLRKAIELSRAHYKLKIKEVEEEKAPGEGLSVIVAGQNLNEMPKSEKLLVLHSSLTTFDVLDSLLSRLVECVEAKKAPQLLP